MLTENISCDYDVTKRTCSFTCTETEEWKCRARLDYYKKENTNERDLHNLRKERSIQKANLSIKNILIGEKDTLIVLKDTLCYQLSSFITDKEVLIADKEAFISRLKSFIADKEALIAGLESLIPQE